MTAMLVRSPRNVVFILLKARQGLPVSVIWERVAERLAWDGPIPTSADIVKLLLEYSLRPRSEDAEPERDGGGRCSGSAMPDNKGGST